MRTQLGMLEQPRADPRYASVNGSHTVFRLAPLAELSEACVFTFGPAMPRLQIEAAKDRELLKRAAEITLARDNRSRDRTAQLADLSRA
jgi:hypothetical protein